jgi:PAS domain S-box-containing protein
VKTPSLAEHKGAAPPRQAPAARMPWHILAAVLLCVAIIIALVLGFLAMSANQIAARDRLEATVAATHALDRVQALIVDAETATRGYALLGRDVMLEPYVNARKRFPAALEDLVRLTADDPAQSSNLEVLRGLADDKWSILSATIESVRKSGALKPAVTETTVDAPGKVIMDAIRARVSLMQVRESEIQAGLAAIFQRAVLYTRLTVLLASGLALVAIFTLYWATKRYLRLRLRAESELRASEERYRVLTEVSPQIIWMADAKGEMTFCNRQWVDYTGLTLEQTIAVGAASVVHEDDRAHVIATWKSAIDRHEPFESEVRLRRGSDNAYRWHLSRARPVSGFEDRTSTWLGAALDIDDRKMIEIALDEFNITLAEQVEERTAELKERTSQLKALNQNLIRVAENERSRLARELHDELGAHLSVAMMDLAIISRQLAETNRADISALARRLTETLNATTQISRRIIADLRPVMIRELGLAGALDAYCAQFELTTAIPCTRLFPEPLEPMVEEAGIALFRIVQESLSNIVKYAKASEVQLELRQTEAYVELSIRDDGAGMAPEAPIKRGTHGLLGIRERAEAFGGTLRITRGLHERGTGIVVTLALDQIVLADADRDASNSTGVAAES